MQAIFEKQAFGEVERLITQKLLGVVKQVAREKLENEDWLWLMASVSSRSYEDMRVSILEFLDADVSGPADRILEYWSGDFWRGNRRKLWAGHGSHEKV